MSGIEQVLVDLQSPPHGVSESEERVGWRHASKQRRRADSRVALSTMDAMCTRRMQRNGDAGSKRTTTRRDNDEQELTFGSVWETLPDLFKEWAEEPGSKATFFNRKGGRHRDRNGRHVLLALLPIEKRDEFLLRNYSMIRPNKRDTHVQLLSEQGHQSSSHEPLLQGKNVLACVRLQGVLPAGAYTIGRGVVGG